MVVEAQGALPFVLEHSQFLPILSRFMGYYTSIWGSGAFSWLLNPNVRLGAGY